ncbi:MAG: class I SAM-dependent methyltransferase [Desulfopila sp.]
MRIYADYDEEPEDHFLPLSATVYQEMYDIELTDFADDLSYYTAHLPSGADILELGCGSGRLSRLLVAAGHRLTGIDSSLAMLRAARTRHTPATLVCADMRALPFRHGFSAIVIAYNTLNLLTDNHDVHRCLTSCRHNLYPGGTLLLQLHLAADTSRYHDGVTFQFQLFDHPTGGKIVKETLRTRRDHRSCIELEERYKLRPTGGAEAAVNFRHILHLNANSRTAWLELIQQAGFALQSTATAYQPHRPEVPGMLLVHAVRTDSGGARAGDAFFSLP